MRIIKRIFVFLIVVIIIVSTAFVSAGIGKYKQALSLIPIEDAVKKIKTDENFTKIEDMSETFVNAMVAVEDKRFYKHNGIDVLGIGRAIVNAFKKGEVSEGGSSITQQLVKNIYFINDNTVSRKIAEAFISLKLEKLYEKDEVLELYFNTIYYGSGYYNVYEASKGYFNKTPSELSSYEATLLAGIPNAPSVYSLKNNPDLAKKRQEKVVKAMVEEKMLAKDEADKILSLNKD